MLALIFDPSLNLVLLQWILDCAIKIFSRFVEVRICGAHDFEKAKYLLPVLDCLSRVDLRDRAAILFVAIKESGPGPVLVDRSDLERQIMNIGDSSIETKTTRWRKAVRSIASTNMMAERLAHGCRVAYHIERRSRIL